MKKLLKNGILLMLILSIIAGGVYIYKDFTSMKKNQAKFDENETTVIVEETKSTDEYKNMSLTDMLADLYECKTGVMNEFELVNSIYIKVNSYETLEDAKGYLIDEDMVATENQKYVLVDIDVRCNYESEFYDNSNGIYSFFLNSCYLESVSDEGHIEEFDNEVKSSNIITDENRYDKDCYMIQFEGEEAQNYKLLYSVPEEYLDENLALYVVTGSKSYKEGNIIIGL